MRWLLAALVCFLAAYCVLPQAASAHPQDEFCAGGSGMDPALCQELARLDSADADPQDRPTADTGLEDTVSLDRSPLETAAFYVGIGFQHILPMGLDHILFVLALFLASTRVRPLLLQISAFTVAHTVTLGLTAAGFIAPPGGIVEPLIALTIAWAAFENILFKEMQPWRPLLAFGFGLIHGMGFAGAFGELGLPQQIFWPALIGFNVGVEVGQLTVIGMALAVSLLVRGVLARMHRADQYRHVLVWPVSLLIGIAGLWWAIERAFLQG
ncbi:MAG: HupE/UreJ family protein [Hyphomonas sp.]|uniref:HupE/UreJ family protein n=1 Tax=Hyphomonas sp. TaxID=87 RepID=UPI0035275514